MKKPPKKGQHNIIKIKAEKKENDRLKMITTIGKRINEIL